MKGCLPFFLLLLLLSGLTGCCCPRGVTSEKVRVVRYINYHPVKGESFRSVAERFGTSESEIEEFNKDIDPSYLVPGRSIIVPVDVQYVTAYVQK